MTTVLEKRPKTRVLEPELMEALGLIQGHVADFDVDYKVHIPPVVACSWSDCGGTCSGNCGEDCSGYVVGG